MIFRRVCATRKTQTRRSTLPIRGGARLDRKARHATEQNILTTRAGRSVTRETFELT